MPLLLQGISPFLTELLKFKSQSITFYPRPFSIDHSNKHKTNIPKEFIVYPSKAAVNPSKILSLATLNSALIL
jgi:hypothetical protein